MRSVTLPLNNLYKFQLSFGNQMLYIQKTFSKNLGYVHIGSFWNCNKIFTDRHYGYLTNQSFVPAPEAGSIIGACQSKIYYVQAMSTVTRYSINKNILR